MRVCSPLSGNRANTVTPRSSGATNTPRRRAAGVAASASASAARDGTSIRATSRLEAASSRASSSARRTPGAATSASSAVAASARAQTAGAISAATQAMSRRPPRRRRRAIAAVNGVASLTALDQRVGPAPRAPRRRVARPGAGEIAARRLHDGRAIIEPDRGFEQPARRLLDQRPPRPIVHVPPEPARGQRRLVDLERQSSQAEHRVRRQPVAREPADQRLEGLPRLGAGPRIARDVAQAQQAPRVRRRQSALQPSRSADWNAPG